MTDKQQPVPDSGTEKTTECEKWCGMNYCDDNGCINRTRHYVSDIPTTPVPDVQGNESVSSAKAREILATRNIEPTVDVLASMYEYAHWHMHGNQTSLSTDVQGTVEEDKIPNSEPGKHKPFIVANVRDILDAITSEEISFIKGVELFNEVAAKYWQSQSPSMEWVRVEKVKDVPKYRMVYHYECITEKETWVNVASYADTETVVIWLNNKGIRNIKYLKQ